MKTIFLDLDGVLNIREGEQATFRHSMHHFDASLISLFENYLESQRHLKIIISSSWRDDMEDMKHELSSVGFKSLHLISGHTEINQKKRGEQIRDYINQYDISNFIIIDDEIEEIEPFFKKNEYIHINPRTGITQKDIEKLIFLL